MEDDEVKDERGSAIETIVKPALFNIYVHIMQGTMGCSFPWLDVVCHRNFPIVGVCKGL